MVGDWEHAQYRLKIRLPTTTITLLWCQHSATFELYKLNPENTSFARGKLCNFLEDCSKSKVDTARRRGARYFACVLNPCPLTESLGSWVTCSPVISCEDIRIGFGAFCAEGGGGGCLACGQGCYMLAPVKSYKLSTYANIFCVAVAQEIQLLLRLFFTLEDW